MKENAALGGGGAASSAKKFRASCPAPQHLRLVAATDPQLADDPTRCPGRPLIMTAKISPGFRVRVVVTGMFLPPDSEDAARDLFHRVWIAAPRDLASALEGHLP